ncbi:hypothetical protein PVK06_035526 [Gossypium arboreum]|uniref:Uncharacterized protein n=1 Tax=Gossypium arboreum TaxID=29729 RepID=A0ABR0NHI1_GOSAR|nr:hypothetical protein PVK06_035526 [Gossypium arboreum]
MDKATPAPESPPVSPPQQAALHQDDAAGDDENVKQLKECSALYLSLQDCLIKSNRNWKSCQMGLVPWRNANYYSCSMINIPMVKHGNLLICDARSVMIANGHLLHKYDGHAEDKASTKYVWKLEEMA